MAGVKAVLGTVNYEVAIEAGPHALAADEPVARGGHGKRALALRPRCSGGLAACTVITLRMYAERKAAGSSARSRPNSPMPRWTGAPASRAGSSSRPISRRTSSPASPEIAEKTPVTLTLKEGADITTHLEAERPHAETKAELDERLDEALEESFPARRPARRLRPARAEPQKWTPRPAKTPCCVVS